MIGPTFELELKKAGLSGLPFSWSKSGEFFFDKSISQSQREAIISIYDSHNPEKEVVPDSVTMRQARLALLKAGKLQAVNNAIAAMTGSQGEAARIEWDYSNEVRRSQPLTIALAQAIGMTEEEMDALFIEAAKL